MTTKRKNYRINFDAVPAIGTEIPYYRGETLTLVKVEPYTRADGATSQRLIWNHSDGSVVSSGLRSAAVTKLRVDGRRIRHEVAS